MIKKFLVLVLSYFSLVANISSPNDNLEAKITELVNSIGPKQISYNGQTLTFFNNPDNFEIGMYGALGLSFFALNSACNSQDRKTGRIQKFNSVNAMLLGISSCFSLAFFYQLYYKTRQIKYTQINKDNFIVNGKIHNLKSISHMTYNVRGNSSYYYSDDYNKSYGYELIAFDASNKQIFKINSGYLTQINSGQFRYLLDLIFKKFNCKITINEQHIQIFNL